ncbi:MAG: ArsR family transcriptional regulator [Acidobacteria bacterium]|nr:MAG: ArsR family transcriptional regulator [Acidobacteriota bacterium]
MTLSPLMQKFILHWGEMGTRWGVNRTVAQVHALLYLSPASLDADEISKTLSVARSNVSTCLKELQSWGIVRPVHLLGDRREHYESLTDVWEMARTILEERKRREIDPTLAMLRECIQELESAPASERPVRDRISEMLGFLEALVAFYEEARRLPAHRLRGLVKIRKKLRRAFGKSGA